MRIGELCMLATTDTWGAASFTSSKFVSGVKTRYNSPLKHGQPTPAADSQNWRRTRKSSFKPNWAVAETPLPCVLFYLPFQPSLSRTFRDAGFFFRGIHVSEIHFRELSRKTCDTNSPFSAVKCALKPLIPSTTGIVLQQLSLWQHVDWYCIWWPPPPSPPRPPPHPQTRAPDLSGHCRTSTASARFQWALCDRGSQWAQPDTTSARSQWALPLPYQMGGGRPS